MALYWDNMQDGWCEVLPAPLTMNVTPRKVREREALALRAQLGDLEPCERYDLGGAL